MFQPIPQEVMQEAADVGDAAVDHHIMSVQSGEDITEDQLGDICDTLAKNLGYEKCPMLAVIHRDTDNIHVHIMTLKVDVETMQPVAGLKFDIVRAHQTMAVLEDRHGWAREPRSHYSVVDGNLVLDGVDVVGCADKPEQWPDKWMPTGKGDDQASAKQLDPAYEEAKQKVIDVAGPILDAAETTEEALRLLAAEGIGLRKKFKGYEFLVDGIEVKASVDRTHGRSQRMARFADLPKDFSADLISRYTKSADPDVAARGRYNAERDAYRKSVTKAGDAFRRAAGRIAIRASDAKPITAALEFPDFDSWRSGQQAPDPFVRWADAYSSAVFKPSANAQWTGRRAQAVPGLDLNSSGKWPMYFARQDYGFKPLFVDADDRILLVGPRDEFVLQKVVILLKLRGATEVEFTGLTKDEQRKMATYGAERGIKISAPPAPAVLNAISQTVYKKLGELRVAKEAIRHKPKADVGAEPIADQGSRKVEQPSAPHPAKQVQSASASAADVENTPTPAPTLLEKTQARLRAEAEAKEAEAQRFAADTSLEAQLIRQWQDPEVKGRERDLAAWRIMQNDASRRMAERLLPKPQFAIVEDGARSHAERMQSHDGRDGPTR